MAVYRVQAPDGTVLRIDGPDDATPAQLTSVAKQHYDAQINPNPADPAQYPEAGGMGNFMAGLGKAAYDKAIGFNQMMGDLGLGPKAVTPQMVDTENKGGLPLMKTGAGMAGNVAGNIAATLPLMAIPGVNTLAGSALAGALYGGTEPVGTNDSRTANTLKGGALFAAVPAIGAALKGAKALVEPAYQSGREAIVGRTLGRFAGDDPAAISNLQNAQQFVPGSLPTAADASGNASLAMLENGAQTRDPIVKQAFAQRLQQNNAARVDALRGVAGDDSQLAFYKANREQAAQGLYQKAFSETPEDSTWIKGQVTQLMSRPAFVDALKTAQTDAMNLGIKVSPDNPENTTQILHLTKQALDDAISKEVASGGSAAGLQDTQSKLVSLMESKGFSPSYREARDTYKQMSAPINQMEVGQYLYNKLQPALNDFGGTTRNKAATFADALRNGDATAQKATGFPGAKLANVMTPDQMASLTGIAKDLSRRSATEDAMRGIGSNTAQNLATQNVMSQMFGPLGLPQSFGQSLIGNAMTVPYLGGLLEFGAKGAESAVQKELAAALLDPKKAAALMLKARTANAPPGLLGYLRAAAPGGLLGISNPGQ